jgi:hypothetical protein
MSAAILQHDNEIHHAITKDQVVLTLMRLSDHDPRVTKVHEVLKGSVISNDEERLLSFTEVANGISYDQSWLRRLGVHENCAIELAGGKRYRRSVVIAYLQSPECQARVDDIRRSRKSVEAKS